jgi:Na+/H+ antiporter NhaD/arsenite permease-like protein
MKKISVIIMTIGLIATLFSNFGFVGNPKLVDAGKEGLTRYEENILMWPPWIGFFIITIGAVIYIYGAKKAKNRFAGRNNTF